VIWDIARFNELYVAVWAKTKIFFIEVAKMVLPFDCKDAHSTDSRKREMKATEASKQVYKPKKTHVASFFS